MRATVKEAINKTSKSGKEFQQITFEKDEETYGNWTKTKLKSGDEIEVFPMQNDQGYWNLFKINVLNDAPKGTQIDVKPGVELVQIGKSDKELFAQLLIAASNKYEHDPEMIMRYRLMRDLLNENDKIEHDDSGKDGY